MGSRGRGKGKGDSKRKLPQDTAARPSKLSARNAAFSQAVLRRERQQQVDDTPTTRGASDASSCTARECAKASAVRRSNSSRLPVGSDEAAAMFAVEDIDEMDVDGEDEDGEEEDGDEDVDVGGGVSQHCRIKSPYKLPLQYSDQLRTCS